MAINRVLYSSISVDWATPGELYKHLDEEFEFKDDPCPIGGSGGLERKWWSPSFVNPPYGRSVSKWIQKALEERKLGVTVVFLLPARTDTRWMHELVLPNAEEIRFVRGRLRFGGAKTGAPFPSMIVIFRGAG